MIYIGPKYGENGIVLPNMSVPTYPSNMTDSEISQLLRYNPQLSIYFDPTANGSGNGGSGEYQNTNCCTELYNSIQSEMNKVATNISQIQVNF